MIWPAIPFKQCDFTLERNIRTFDSGFNHSSQQGDYGGSFWSAEIELAWLTRYQSGAVLGLLAEHGRSGILLPDAPHAQPAGVGGGEPVTVGENQGGLVTIGGAPVSMPGWLKAGDLVQIGNHMYLLTRDANTDESGVASLAIQPYLRSMPAPGTPIRIQDCACLMQLEPGETIPRRTTRGKRYLADLKLKFVEVIQ